MPVELSERRKRTRAISVDVGGGETVMVTFKPAAVVADMEEQAYRRAPGEGMLRVVARQLAAVLVETDITDGGKPIALDEATLAGLGFELLRPIMDAIMEAVTVRPGESVS